MKETGCDVALALAYRFLLEVDLGRSLFVAFHIRATRCRSSGLFFLPFHSSPAFSSSNHDVRCPARSGDSSWIASNAFARVRHIAYADLPLPPASDATNSAHPRRCIVNPQHGSLQHHMTPTPLAILARYTRCRKLHLTREDASEVDVVTVRRQIFFSLIFSR